MVYIFTYNKNKYNLLKTIHINTKEGYWVELYNLAAAAWLRTTTNTHHLLPPPAMLDSPHIQLTPGILDSPHIQLTPLLSVNSITSVVNQTSFLRGLIPW